MECFLNRVEPLLIIDLLGLLYKVEMHDNNSGIHVQCSLIVNFIYELMEISWISGVFILYFVFDIHKTTG